MIKFIRHGDLNFHTVEKIEGEKVKTGTSIVLQEGETTGHKHVLTVQDPKDMMVYKLPTGEWMIDLRSQGTLTHEDHKTIVIQPGIYKQTRERELDHFRESLERTVVD